MNTEDMNKLPLGMRHQEITEQDYETLYRVVDDPAATVGRLRRVPKGIPEK